MRKLFKSVGGFQVRSLHPLLIELKSWWNINRNRFERSWWNEQWKEWIQTGTSLTVHDKFAAGFENWLEQLPFNSSPGRYRVVMLSMDGLASGISGTRKGPQSECFVQRSAAWSGNPILINRFLSIYMWNIAASRWLRRTVKSIRKKGKTKAQLKTVN